jgi:hypothetical protein
MGQINIDIDSYKEDEYDEEKARWLAFKCAVQALALPAEIQPKLLPPWVCVDELALDFDHWRRVITDLYGHMLCQNQRQAINALDSLLEQMSGRDKAEFWEGQDCLKHPKWSEVRQLAMNVLAAFGWSLEVPEVTFSMYINSETGEIWPDSSERGSSKKEPGNSPNEENGQINASPEP